MKKEKWLIPIVAIICIFLAVNVVLLNRIAGKLKDILNKEPVQVSTYSEPCGYVNLYINGQYTHLVLGQSPAMIEVPSLNCEVDLSIRADVSPAYEIYFDGIEISDGHEIAYRLQMLDQNYTVPIWVVNRANGGVTSYVLSTFPSAIPDYTFVGESPYEGDYYLTLIAGIDNVAMKVGQDGQLKYYYCNPYGCLADFKKVTTKDGLVRYLYFTTRSNHYGTRGVSHLGEYVVMDEQYHEVNRLTMVKSEHIPADSYPVDQHDCLYISDNEYYLITYADKNVYNIPDTVPHKEYGSLVTAAVIQGFRNGELFFEWDSTDYPELYALSVDFNDFTNSTSTYAADYMHINSIDIDPSDGNIIASFRDIDSVMKINTTTGEIMWKLSGIGDDFGLADNQKTSRQHYARYTEVGSITVYDNGNKNSQSRVVEYWLDEENKQLLDFKSYQVDGYYSMATGSVHRLDNTRDAYMIGWGTRTAGDVNGLYPQFSEIDFTAGETLAEFRFKDTKLSTYRCVKIK